MDDEEIEGLVQLLDDERAHRQRLEQALRLIAEAEKKSARQLQLIAAEALEAD